MSILGLWDHMYYDAPDDLIDEEEDAPVYPPDAFTFTASGGWWSAGPDLTEDDE
jgi:hypothetical protein